MADVTCPTCKTKYPNTMGRCPACGTSNPAMMGVPSPTTSPVAATASAAAAAAAATPRKTGEFLKDSMENMIKSNRLQFAIFLILGVMAILGLMRPLAAFGIPAIQLNYLGMALILWAFYQILPTEGQVLSDAEIGTRWTCPVNPGHAAISKKRKVSKPPKCPRAHYTPQGVRIQEDIYMTPQTTVHEFTSEHMGPLYIKSFLKLLVIIFLAMQFYDLSLLLTLIILFAAYFTLPTSYKTTQPYKSTEAWFRMLLGVMIAIVLVMFFSPGATALAGGIGVGLIVMAIAVSLLTAFTAAYAHKKWKNDIVTLVVAVLVASVLQGTIGGLITGFGLPAFALFYLTLAFFTAMPERKEPEKDEAQVEVVGVFESAHGKFADFFKDNKEKMDSIGTGVFIGFAVMGFFPIVSAMASGAPSSFGWSVMIVLVMSIIMGIMGGRAGRPYIGTIMLIFAIIAFSFAYTDTVGTAVFGQYWGTVEATGEMFFGPIGESMDRANCEAYATWLCVSEGPAKCAEEKLKCERHIANTIGAQTAIEFQNFKIEPSEYYTGGENAIYFELINKGDFDATDVTLEVPKRNGEVTVVAGKEDKDKIGTVTIDSCGGGEQIEGQNMCIWQGAMPKNGKGAALITIKWDKDISPEWYQEEDVTYKGLFPKIKLIASYDYDVRSSYKVDVRSSDELRRLLFAGETLAGEVAQFSGGPITASLWTPKYIESGKDTLVTASLTNMKNGEAENPVYCIYVPEEAVIKEGSGKSRGKIDLAGTGCTEKPKTKAVRCSWERIKSVTEVDENAKPLNSRTCSFKMKLDIGAAPEKQLAMVGEANYHYVVTKIEKGTAIAFVSETFR